MARRTTSSSSFDPARWAYGDTLYELPTSSPPDADGSAACPCTKDAALEPDRCASFLEEARAVPWAASTTLYDTPDSRLARSHWLLPEPRWWWVYEHVAALFLEANRAFGFDLRRLVDPILVVEYPPGPGMDWHLDALSGVTRSRKLSLTLPLTAPSSYEGGELEIAPFGSDPAWRAQGAATVFPSYLCHRVRPIHQGTRSALVAWAHGTPFR